MAEAFVTCRDGKIRRFVADHNEVFHWNGRQFTYAIWPEPEGRGFITMIHLQNNWVLARSGMQPLRIEAKTWAGEWEWKERKRR